MFECRMPRLARWAAVGVAVLTLVGTSLAAAKKPAPKKPGAGGISAADGKKVYDNLGCANCHKIGSEGGAAGPELTGEGKRRDMKFLVEKLKNPKMNNPNSIMPPVTKPDKDVQALAAYLMSLK
jgi:mono/diheme cytochrome c family protein